MFNEQKIDYSAIKLKLSKLQPKNKTSLRDTHLIELMPSIIEARQRHVSVSAIASSLKENGIKVSAQGLTKFLKAHSKHTLSRRRKSEGNERSS
jgi:hypothetical protein